MSSTVTSRRTVSEATHGQSQVSLPMLGAARTDQALSDGQHSVNGNWILPVIKRAQERVMSQKAALITMGIAKTQYIENLQGIGHLSVRRLGLMPEDFWVALMDELRAHFRMENDEERLRRALDARAACDRVIEEIARKGLR